MAFTFQEEVSNGVQSVYPVDFEFDTTDTVYVYTGEHTDYANQLSYRWLPGNTEIELTNLTEVPNGVQFYIRRIVPRDRLVHIFANRSIRGRLVDEENKHLLYLFQEALDGFLSLDAAYTVFGDMQLSGDLDMQSNRIVNLLKPDSPTEPVRLQDIDAFVSEAIEGAVLEVIDKLKPKAYEVPRFSGNSFTLLEPTTFVFVDVNGRLLAPSLVSLSANGLEVTLSTHVTMADRVVARVSMIDDDNGQTSSSNVVTFKDVKAITELMGVVADGTQAILSGYHNTYEGGGGILVYDENLPKTEHNGVTVFDPLAPFPLDWADQPQLVNWYGSSNLGNGCWVRVKDKAVIDTWAGVRAGYDNTEALQALFDSSESDIGLTRGLGAQAISRPLTLAAGRSIVGEGRHNETKLIGNFEGGVIYNPDGQWWKNKFKNVVFENQFNSPHAAGLKGTMYQCEVHSCGFTSMFGKGLHLLGNAYSVENVIEYNYFNGCAHGIYAESNTHANTDAHVGNNLWWRGSGSKETDIINDIYWENPSGSRFYGNHPYGGSNDAMYRFIGGINVGLTNEYFEMSDNPRVKISSGNPGSYAFANCSFWGGDGNKVDAAGDKSSIISLYFNLYNRGIVTFENCNFEGGVNDALIFSMRNGGAGLADVKVNFSRSNTVSGSYKLAEKAASGTAEDNVLGRIYTDHSEFVFENTTQNLSVSSVACSEFHQYDTGNAVTFMTIPNTPNWCDWFPKTLRNFSDTTAISLSSGATINNNRQILPGEVVVIRTNNAGEYLLEFLKEVDVGLSATVYNPVAMDFGGTTVPANGYLESNIDLEGYALTNPNTILTCTMKGLSAGLVATFYYDGATFNTWKMRVSNPTAGAINLNSTSAIVVLFE